MAKIWTVSDYDSLWIFSTQEKAAEFARRTGHDAPGEEELDPQPPELVDGCYAWCVQLGDDVEARNINLEGVGAMPRAWSNGKETSVRCHARTEQAAIDEARRLIEPHAQTIEFLKKNGRGGKVDLPV